VIKPTTNFGARMNRDCSGAPVLMAPAGVITLLTRADEAELFGHKGAQRSASSYCPALLPFSDFGFRIYERPASCTRIDRRNTISPSGAIVAVSAMISHMVPECRGPFSGQYLASSVPETVPTISFANRNGA